MIKSWLSKSTYSELIKKELNIPHIYTDDMMEQLAKQDTPDGRKVKELLSKGEFAPTSIVIDAVKERLQRPDAQKDISLMVFLEVYNRQKMMEMPISNMTMLLILLYLRKKSLKD